MKKIGRYEVVEELGRGAMGVVYKASDPTIGRLVAIKVLSLDSSAEPGLPSLQETFMREARAAGRLSHPGIVAIHDALEDPETKSNFIVMEFVPGRTLEKILLTAPPLSSEKALEIARQIAEALEYAHQQKIIHRDLKPANILVNDRGQIKITDFGLAKIVEREGALRTAAIMGTPAYMSPEQVTGGEVDTRSDLFAFGILLYLMLAGEKPFAGDTAAVMFKIVYEDPAAPSQIKPGLGAGLDYLVLRCLVKDPNKRYGSAREFLDDLDDVQHGNTPRSEAKFPLAEIRTGERTVIAARGTRGWAGQLAPAPAKKWTWVVGGMGAGVALLLLLLGTGILIYRGRHKPPPSSAVSQAAPALPAAQTAGTAPPSSSPIAKPNEAVGQNPMAESNSAQPSPSSELGNTPPGGATVVPSAPQAVRKERKTRAPAAESASAHTGAQENVVQVSCRFELQKAALTVSSDGDGVILKDNLAGKKKKGFFGLKGGYSGVFSHPITIPAGTRVLSVQVVSSDPALDLTKEISLSSLPNTPATLEINVRANGLSLRWAQSPAP